ncbi:hypothetical protein V493_00704 [Pseudogymnoascus sp. VKM F-4281 (FW-2241)]|nr:hypothetical protein V493_00704 [Pseudogymnoascus sp. VKM F-4281 (FW-2241)]
MMLRSVNKRWNRTSVASLHRSSGSWYTAECDNVTSTAANPIPSSVVQYPLVVLEASSASPPSPEGSTAPSRHASPQLPPPTSSGVPSSRAGLDSGRSYPHPSSAFALPVPSHVASPALAGIVGSPPSSRLYTACYPPGPPSRQSPSHTPPPAVAAPPPAAPPRPVAQSTQMSPPHSPAPARSSP